ncbi:MAG: lysophospholipid acyltransferase family protein, partial [Chloroflexales bacterium]|nr:lysophospholipid acyltransferase family protein [Chloroflexales bacterium]
RIEVQGQENIPVGKPTIFVSNHPNGLIDGLVLMLGLDRIVSFLTKSTFFANPPLRLCLEAFAAVPVYRRRDAGKTGGPQTVALDRNDVTFARCRELLARGQAVALFPEGMTHAGTTMQPLHTGAARIALSTEAEAGWELETQIVPVAIWYTQKSQFRSRVLLVIGQPFDLAGMAAAYASDPYRAACDLTERIREHLDKVVLQSSDAERYQLALDLVAWTLPQDMSRTLYARYAHTTLLLAAMHRFSETDPARLEALLQQAQSYARMLRSVRVADPFLLEDTPHQRRQLIALTLALLAGAAPALAGLASSYLPARLAGPLATRIFGKSDEMTITSKLVVGVGLVGTSWLVEALIVGRLAGARWAGIFLLSAPILSYSAVRWSEGWHTWRALLAAQYLRYRNPQLIQKLIDQRQALADVIVTVTSY